MRCLYCGKELALLKRLTGGGEFCSEAHKQRYQEEYDRIALSRLLQAQKKAPPANAPAVQSPPAQPAPVTMEEPAVAERAVAEPAIHEPVQDQLGTPQETAGFVVEQPEVAGLPEEEAPYLESWVEGAETPAVPHWGFELARSDLSQSGLIPLKGLPKQYDKNFTVSEADWTSESSAPAKPELRIPQSPARSWAPPHPLDKSVMIEVPVRIVAVNSKAASALDFQVGVEFGESALLETLPSSVEFPAEDSDAVIPAAWTAGPVFDTAPARAVQEKPETPIATEPQEELAVVQATARGLDADRLSPVTTSPGPAPFSVPVAGHQPAMPHDTLEALSRMHHRMQFDPSRESASEAEEVVAVETIETPEAVPEAAPESAPEAAPESREPAPKLANDLLELPTKIFTLGKRGLAGVNALPAIIPPLLPRIRALPLRPKVASAAPGSIPETKTLQHPSRQGDAKAPADAEAPAATAPQSSSVKPKPAPVGKTEKPAPKAQASPVKPAAPPKAAPTWKPAPATPSKEPHEKAGAKSAATEETARLLDAKRVSSKPESSPPAAEPAGQKSSPVNATAPSPSEERLPSFGSIGRSNTSLWGSLKLKLIIATSLVLGCVAYFGWGGKPQKAASSKSAISADGAGPSVILGEGGWEVGWGGDSTGPRSDREITIYRPSLKLSDYRIEFQGDIETKSMGWVFRASDPDNYYAMKITTVSTGLSPKVALFKYIVVKGHPTPVGRVPIDVEVRNDTVFKVRVDVLGPKFSTFVQGQPVDVWTDDQLKSGGVGFLNERGERGRIKSVSIRYLSGDNR